MFFSPLFLARGLRSQITLIKKKKSDEPLLPPRHSEFSAFPSAKPFTSLFLLLEARGISV